MEVNKINMNSYKTPNFNGKIIDSHIINLEMGF